MSGPLGTTWYVIFRILFCLGDAVKIFVSIFGWIQTLFLWLLKISDFGILTKSSDSPSKMSPDSKNLRSLDQWLLTSRSWRKSCRSISSTCISATFASLVEVNKDLFYNGRFSPDFQLFAQNLVNTNGSNHVI